MADSTSETPEDGYIGRAVEAAIRIGIVALIALWALFILRPFVNLVLWAAVLAIGLDPLYVRVRSMLGERGKLAAAVVTTALLALVLVPSGRLVASSIGEARAVLDRTETSDLHVPPPPANVRDWPLIGEIVYTRWNSASVNLGDTLREIQPQIEAAAKWALSALSGLTGAIAQMLIAILISGVLLYTGEASRAFWLKLSTRLAGEAGGRFLHLTAATIRSVFIGVLGVAAIQASLAGIGMLMLGVPGALLWALLILISAVIQLPILLILGPVMIWAFATQSTVAAVVFLVYGVAVGMSDTFLKPMLMGRGLDVPMLVILLGAIGGMITSGLIGLFVGAVVLAVAYQLLMAWVEQSPDRNLQSEATKPPA